MSTLKNNQIYINGGYANGRKRKALHPKVRSIFSSWEAECRAAGLELQFYSGTRTLAHQAELRKEYLAGRNGGIYASPPGSSLHNYSLAVDTRVFDKSTGKYVRKKSILTKVAKIGAKHGLRWGGNFSHTGEQHHFDYSFGLGLSGIKKLYNDKKVDAQDYVIIDGNVNVKKQVSYQYDWKTDIGEEVTEVESEEKEVEKEEPPKKITNVEERPAVGIWQIIKFMADRYSLGQSINDATIAFNQGSLTNFIQKVVQSPWLHFWGDTFEDEYFFMVRKEPFDYNGFSITPQHRYTVGENDVISDDLSWYDGPIYSWYQIIPQGSFLGEENQIFAHVTAVFFEEYAEVWGSKPFSAVSNYINFIKLGDGKIMYEKALEDLRYMVESNAYLPFTRQGTITIRGNARFKRGFWFFYESTREWFYVDGVNHRYVITDAGEEMLTTLKVSRGMETRHLIAPKDKNTKSYFNLILFDDPPPTTKTVKDKVSGSVKSFYFDNDRRYLIDLNETWPPAADTTDLKMQNQISEFPLLRKELHTNNENAIKECVLLIEQNPKATFKSKGWIDSDFGSNNSVLPIERAKTVRRRVVDAYMKKHPTDNRSELEARISVNGYKVANYGDDFKKNQKDETEKSYKIKAKQRIAQFEMESYLKDKEVEEKTKGVNWKVNDEVFKYFLSRKQLNRC